LFFLILANPALAKQESALTILWPSADRPTLKLTFGKFRELGTYAGQNSFVADVTVENLSSKTIPRASFTVYLLDKNKVRIGDAVLRISDLDRAQSEKVAFQFNSVGIPASLDLAGHNDSSGYPRRLRPCR
jgi:hypothetical protein